MIDILEGAEPEVLAVQIKLVTNLLADRFGDADAARIGDRLEPRRDVDAISVDVLALDDHVTEVDADARVDTLLGTAESILARLVLLNAHGALHGVYDT